MTSPPLYGRCPTSALLGSGVYVPVVVVVEVPFIREIPPRGGPVTVPSNPARFLVFVGLGLIFQDLGDDPAVGFGGNEDFREDQRSRWSAWSLTLVLSDSSRLGSGRGGLWRWW